MLRIDPTSPLPPFEQVRRQFAADIEQGRLAPGTKLPTVRRLADDLGIAPNTIARSYRELEAAGLVVTRGRNGTIVADREFAVDATAVELAVAYLTSMRERGHGSAAALLYVQRAIGST